MRRAMTPYLSFASIFPSSILPFPASTSRHSFSPALLPLALCPEIRPFYGQTFHFISFVRKSALFPDKPSFSPVLSGNLPLLRTNLHSHLFCPEICPFYGQTFLFISFVRKSALFTDKPSLSPVLSGNLPFLRTNFPFHLFCPEIRPFYGQNPKSIQQVRHNIT